MIQNKEKNFISAVIYVHNAEKQLAHCITHIQSVLYENFEKYEIICVNDACTDNSIAILKEAAKNFDGFALTVVSMSFFHGIESAMNAGIDLAIGDFVLEFDTTFMDYDSSLIMDIYNKSLQGFDIVSATNGKSKWSSRLFYSLYNSHSNSQKITGETFRILSRRAINRIHSMSKTIPYRKSLYASCGLKITSVMYAAKQTSKRETSKLLHTHRQNTAFTTFILFTDLAYKVSIAFTFLMMLATLAGIAYTVFVIVTCKPVVAYTATILVLTIAFFGIFSILAIIIKYLTVMVDLVFNRQKYLIEGIEKIKG